MMTSQIRHCPHCGQSLRHRDVQCDACLRVIARSVPFVDPALVCVAVLVMGAAFLLWQLGTGMI